MKITRTLPVAIVAALVSFASRAEEAWPARPVKLIVPSSPGGGTDVFARLLGQSLGDLLKQPFIGENRPGANGNIGAEAVARSKPGRLYLAGLGERIVGDQPRNARESLVRSEFIRRNGISVDQ